MPTFPAVYSVNLVFSFYLKCLQISISLNKFKEQGWLGTCWIILTLCLKIITRTQQPFENKLRLSFFVEKRSIINKRVAKNLVPAEMSRIRH